MRSIWKRSLLVALATLGAVPAGICQTTSEAAVIRAISQSHIDGNSPAPADFDKLLERDLTVYFTKRSGKKVTVGYQYLRKGPTQSGISFPKYYLWVRVYKNKKLIDSGAVRVAAIDRTRFEVTHYLSEAQIRKQPGSIEAVFPALVCDAIRQIVKSPR